MWNIVALAQCPVRCPSGHLYCTGCLVCLHFSTWLQYPLFILPPRSSPVFCHSAPVYLQAFWGVVQEDLSAEERRKLLLFITGTDRLPEASCEDLSIEVSVFIAIAPSHPSNREICVAILLSSLLFHLQSDNVQTRMQRSKAGKITLNA